MKKPEYTLQQVTSMGGNARAKALTKSERVSIASNAARARWAKHEDRKSFKKWGKPSRTMTETKEGIERRKAASKSESACNVGINNTKGDPYKLSPRFAKHTTT